MNAPYPGYPPSYCIVNNTGGYDRTCLVVELLSLGVLTDHQLTHIKEQLEATLNRLLPAIVDKSQVVTPNRFDTLLRSGLRVS